MGKIRTWWDKFVSDKTIGLESNESYKHWFTQLSNYCIDMFTWKGLLDSIPQKEIEKVLLIQSGVGGLIRADYEGCPDFLSGGYFFLEGTESGVTPYEDVFTHFAYGTSKLIGGTDRVNTENCVVCYNNPLKTSLFTMIHRYATLLAHAEVTACVDLINSRMTDAFVAYSDTQAKSIRKYKDAVRLGKTEVLVTEDIDQIIMNGDGVPSLLESQRQHLADDALKAWELQNEILRSFFRDIGKRFSKDKKERLVEAEVVADDEMILLNVNLMLHSRQDFCERVNKYMGLSFEVELNRKEENEREAMENIRTGKTSESERDSSVGNSI